MMAFVHARSGSSNAPRGAARRRALASSPPASRPVRALARARERRAERDRVRRLPDHRRRASRAVAHRPRRRRRVVARASPSSSSRVARRVVAAIERAEPATERDEARHLASRRVASRRASAGAASACAADDARRQSDARDGDGDARDGVDRVERARARSSAADDDDDARARRRRGRGTEGGVVRRGGVRQSHRRDARDDDARGRRTTTTAMTREGALESIRADYAEEYFVSGRGEMAAYAGDCEFADPFVSFRGLDRFRANVANLGGMMREVDLQIKSFEETEDGVQTEWRFSCVLDLPWRPMLAASGGTTHVLNDENRVVRHYERWDVDPKKVLGQLLKPASKIPENQAEVFMASAGSGDVVGASGAVAPVLLRASAPLWLTSAALRAGTHTESTGIEGFFGWLFALACVSQVAKFLRGHRNFLNA